MNDVPCEATMGGAVCCCSPLSQLDERARALPAARRAFSSPFHSRERLVSRSFKGREWASECESKRRSGGGGEEASQKKKKLEKPPLFFLERERKEKLFFSLDWTSFEMGPPRGRSGGRRALQFPSETSKLDVEDGLRYRNGSEKRRRADAEAGIEREIARRKKRRRPSAFLSIAHKRRHRGKKPLAHFFSLFLFFSFQPQNRNTPHIWRPPTRPTPARRSCEPQRRSQQRPQRAP